MKNISIIYILSEIVVLLIGLIDYNIIHTGDSFFVLYFGVLITFFCSIGVIISVALLVLFFKKKIAKKDFLNQIGFAVLGIIFPIFILFVMVSQLH